MKKLILFIFLLASVYCFGQPQKQTIGNTSSVVFSPGVYQAQKGIVPGRFFDTTAANTILTTFFNGIPVYNALGIFTTNDKTSWWRDSILNKWSSLVSIGGIDTSNHWVNRIEKNLTGDSIIYWINTTRFAVYDPSTSGSTNTNIGAFFRWAVPGTNNIKTFAPGLWMQIDSSSNTNALTVKADSATIASYIRSTIPAAAAFTVDPLGTWKMAVANTNDIKGLAQGLYVDLDSAATNVTINADTTLMFPQIRSTIPAAIAYYNSNIGSGYRWTVPGTNNVKTFFMGYGLLSDSTTNTNGITTRFDSATVAAYIRSTIPAFTVDPLGTFKMAVANTNDVKGLAKGLYISMDSSATNVTPGVDSASMFPVIRAFNPQLNVLGTIYNKTGFTSLATDGLTSFGGGTYTPSGGSINVSGGTADYLKGLYIDTVSRVEKWKIGIKFRVTASAAINGIAIGAVSANGTLATPEMLWFRPFDGFLRIEKGTLLTSYAISTTALTFSLTDQLVMTFERNYNVFTGTIRDQTTNSALLTVTFRHDAVYGGTGSPILPNTSRYGLWNLGGTFTVDSLNVFSEEPKQSDIYFFGDSKTDGAWANTFERSWVNLLRTQGLQIINSAGSGDKAIDWVNHYAEAVRLNARVYILTNPSNSQRAGTSAATYQAQYNSLYTALVATGKPVVHLEAFYETAQDNSAWNTYLSSTYSAGTIIPMYDVLQKAGALVADGIHPSEYGNKLIYDRIIQYSYLFGIKGKERISSNNAFYSYADGRVRLMQSNVDSPAVVLAFGPATSAYFAIKQTPVSINFIRALDNGSLAPIRAATVASGNGIQVIGQVETAFQAVNSGRMEVNTDFYLTGVGSTGSNYLKGIIRFDSTVFRQNNINSLSLSPDQKILVQGLFRSGPTLTIQKMAIVDTVTSALQRGDIYYDVLNTRLGVNAPVPTHAFTVNGQIKVFAPQTDATPDSVATWKDGVLSGATLASLGSGSGTVTSVAAGYGTSFSTITTSGSVIADSTKLLDKTARNIVSGIQIFTAQPILKFDQNTETQSDSKGILIKNYSPAVLATQSISPPVIIAGEGWSQSGSASHDVRYRMDVLPATDINATGTWRLASSVNGGAYTNRLTVNSAGVIVGSASITAPTIGATTNLYSSGSGGATTYLAVGTTGNLTYRTTNGGSDVNSQIGFVPEAAATAGAKAWYFETNTNGDGVVLGAGNGTRQIARANIELQPGIVNTAGSETGALVIGTKPSGGAITDAISINTSQQLRIHAISNTTLADSTVYIEDGFLKAGLFVDELVGARLAGSSIKGQPLGLSPANLTATGGLADGIAAFTIIYLPQPATLTGVGWWQALQGSYTADQTNGVALYTMSAGTMTKVAESTNDGNIWKATANTWNTKAFSSTYAAAAGMYVVATLYNNSAQTTAPTIGTGGGATNAAMQTIDFTNSVKLNSSLSGQNTFPTPQAMSGTTTVTGRPYLYVY